MQQCATLLYWHHTCIPHLITTCTPLQHFLNYDKDGNERAQPFSGQLTDKDGPDQAVRFLDWLENNMPGFEHSRKAPKLVSVVSDWAGDSCSQCSAPGCIYGCATITTATCPCPPWLPNHCDCEKNRVMYTCRLRDVASYFPCSMLLPMLHPDLQARRVVELQLDCCGGVAVADMILLCVQTPSVLDACVSALQARYQEQQSKLRWETIKKLRQYGPFTEKYNTIRNRLQEKGRRASGKQDPQVC